MQHIPYTLRTVAAVACWLGPAPAALVAQQAVYGVVRDAAGQPLEAVEVFLGDNRQPERTGRDGRFRFEQAPWGPVWIAARRIGYEPVRRSVTIRRGENQDVNLVMVALPLNLPELEVTASSGFGAGGLRAVWLRVRASGGSFITREDMERRRPLLLSELVRPLLPFAALTVSERALVGSFVGQLRVGTPEPVHAHSRTRRCGPAISLNGDVPLEGRLLDDFPVDRIEALEVYKFGWPNIPVEFANSRRAAKCGLVILWFR